MTLYEVCCATGRTVKCDLCDRPALFVAGDADGRPRFRCLWHDFRDPQPAPREPQTEEARS